ncbi:MAG TPA: hypothetical protein VJ840_14125, partial [Gemmatimonadaceae bacterium]|nr:hypothetical protein [Gemmatimonadaceae bacterium]
MTSTAFERAVRAGYASALIICACAPVAVVAQSRLTVLDFTAGSEMEDYLRVMQIAGKVPLYPWSIRAFSRREITRLATADSTGPWNLRSSFSSSPATLGPLRVAEIFNSAFPYGANDGPVWAGRGLTSVVSGGIAAALGPISIAIDPLAFRANNTSFDLLPNGQTGALAFNHGTFTDLVDFPQRFGSTAYSRIDPGNSSLRFDSHFVTFGVSTANEWIGPATEYPFLLSNNAPGFPHIFVGTGEPLSIWIARVHARLMWGKLYQSNYSPVTGPTTFAYDTSAGALITGGTIRLAASGQLVLSPRGIPGLEIGIARFFHVPNTVDEPNAAFWKKPIRVVFLRNEIASGDLGGFDNQLASAFFRWVFPHAGLEVYGERGFDDQLYDMRDLILNLDHEREYMLGFQKTLRTTAKTIDVLRVEAVNYQKPGLARDRAEAGIYVHAHLHQGHTNRGQLLGASPGVGWAAASSLAWTRYSPGGRTTATLRRIVQDQRGDFETTAIIDPRANDVIIAAAFERTWQHRRGADFGAKIEVMENYNRNFSKDVPNLNLQFTTRLHS